MWPEHLAQRRGDTELGPQPVEQPGGAHRTRPDHRHCVTDHDTQITVVVVVVVGFAEGTGDRRHQPAQNLTVQAVLATRIDQHLRLPHSLHVTVGGEPHVTHDAAIGLTALRRAQIHVHTIAAPPHRGDVHPSDPLIGGHGHSRTIGRWQHCWRTSR